MRKLVLIMALLMISALAFGDSSGSASLTTDYDVDAEELKETLDTKIVMGPVTLGNILIFSALLAEEPGIDWALAVDYALNAAIAFGVKTGCTVDKAVPLTFTASWKIADFFTVSAKYVNDNLSPAEGAEVETGAFQLVLKATF